MNAALCLRALARDALLSCGGRGFVRFMADGEALLCTDALRRCEEPEALLRALKAAGFVCAAQDGLLTMSPGDALLEHLTGAADAVETEWEGTRCAAQALAARWLRFDRQPLTDAGRRVVMETLRLCWQDDAHVLAGLSVLRGLAACMQRGGDTSGLYEAGAILQGRMTADEA